MPTKNRKAIDLASSVQTIKTLRIDADKLDRALGAAAKPVCDFLEGLANLFGPPDDPDPAEQAAEDEGEHKPDA